MLALNLLANQYAAGIALTILGGGLSAFLGREFGAAPIEPVEAVHIPVLSDIPVIGRILFDYDPLVYVAFLLFGLVWWMLFRTRAGLVLRIIGENPQAGPRHRVQGHSHPVPRGPLRGARWRGSAAPISPSPTPPSGSENMTAGRGWIALALVVFASWRPLRVLLGALLFGGVNILQLHAQGQGIGPASEFLSALPYVATILVLVLISRNRQTQKVNFPASLAKPFRPGH